MNNSSTIRQQQQGSDAFTILLTIMLMLVSFILSLFEENND
jgi:hypothetical protein